jgi:hypothetical protein
MYVRPAHFDLPCADRLTQSTASLAVYLVIGSVSGVVHVFGPWKQNVKDYVILAVLQLLKNAFICLATPLLLAK